MTKLTSGNSTLTIQSIKFSKSDKSKGLKLPLNCSEDLAYICGVLAGDGCLYERKNKDYEINCGGNPHNEREFYNQIIKPVIKRTFNLDIQMRLIGNKSTYGFVIHSKALFTFLTRNIGLPTGKKYPYLRIPICFDTKPLKIAFLQGVADTDFSLCLKKRSKTYPYYPVVAGCSKSKAFILDLYDVLSSLGLIPYLSLNSTYYDWRFDKVYKISRLEIVGHKKLKRWMKLIGFRNPKYLKRYKRYLEIKTQAKYF